MVHTMYVAAEIIAEVEARYGSPEEVALTYEMTRREFDFVRSTQKHGRAHDITFFILEQNRVLLIKKPPYPPGAYRAPSGGIEPGEPFEAGVAREAYEETGLTIALGHYLFRFCVRFACEDEVIDWTTHVVTATPTGGTLCPVDTVEIAEARYASVSEINGSIREALLSSGSTGLRYRADLSDRVMSKLIALKLLR